ncbi:MAG: succinate dehydrogenase, cytochrome b556 subunit [Herminiimonas sp.]|nr:succinate dehydrogenase, cytochrome b556 subunit [Herminiimonas sp.]
MSEVSKKRPEFRNIHISQLVNYRLPLAGLISILHRVSGAILFLLLPLVLYLLDQSLVSENTFAAMRGFTSNWFVKLIILGLSWAFLHHFFAGIRHLGMDTHMGLEKQSSRRSSAAVLAVSLFLTALVALKLFGAF